MYSRDSKIHYLWNKSDGELIHEWVKEKEEHEFSPENDTLLPCSSYQLHVWVSNHLQGGMRQADYTLSYVDQWWQIERWIFG